MRTSNCQFLGQTLIRKIRMRFSFKAKKGFLGATISGVIHVNQDSVVMDSELPGLVTAFVSEDQIRNVINEQLDGLFPA